MIKIHKGSFTRKQLPTQSADLAGRSDWQSFGCSYICTTESRKVRSSMDLLLNPERAPGRVIKLFHEFMLRSPLCSIRTDYGPPKLDFPLILFVAQQGASAKLRVVHVRPSIYQATCFGASSSQTASQARTKLRQSQLLR